jgi:hypothetical protein
MLDRRCHLWKKEMDRMSAETSQQAILAQDWPKPATTAVWLLTAAYVAAAMILWPERYFPILLDSTLSGIVPLIAIVRRQGF